MEILKRINKTVKAKQIGKIIGGITCCGIGLYLLCDYLSKADGPNANNLSINIIRKNTQP